MLLRQAEMTLGLHLQRLSAENGGRPTENGFVDDTAHALPNGLAAQLHAALPDKARTYLCGERQINREVVDRYQLGFVIRDQGRYITIPVSDLAGEVRDILLWCPPNSRIGETPEIRSWASRAQGNLPYPVDQLTNDVLVMVCDPLVVLALVSHGIPAVTLAGGVTAVPDQHAGLLVGKTVILPMDHDEAGRNRALKRAALLSPYMWATSRLPSAEGSPRKVGRDSGVEDPRGCLFEGSFGGGRPLRDR